MNYTFLFEVSPIKPDGSIETLHLCSTGSSSKSVYLDGKQWLPLIETLPDFEFNLVAGGQLQYAQVSYGDIEFICSEVYDNEVWSSYDWTNAQGRCWYGLDGDPFENFAQVFEGKVSGFNRSEIYAKIALLGSEADIQVPALYLRYDGIGGREGGPGVKGNLKPRTHGAAINIEPLAFDTVNWVYQVHGYGAVQSIPAVYEFGQALAESVGNTSSYEALVALDLEPGEWATCLAEGMFRLGGQPDKKLTCDVLGGKLDGVYGSTAKQIIQQLIREVQPSAQFGTFPACFDVDWCFYSAEASNVWDIVYRAAFEVGGYIFPDGLGVWQAGDFYSPIARGELRAERSTEPLIVEYEEKTSTGPIWRVSVGYERVWSPHSISEISPAIFDASKYALKQDMEEAQARYDAALADRTIQQLRLDQMASDGMLTRAEKRYWVLKFDYETNALNEALEDSSPYDVAAQRTAYQTAYDGLDTYLATLEPSWSDAGSDTPVDYATWATKWNALWDARVALAEAMVGVAEWGKVIGSGKPEDNATEGGTIGENIKDGEGNVLAPEDLITEEGTAKYVSYIGDFTTEDFQTKVTDAEAEIAELIETYGSTAAASESALAAQQAMEDALAAADAAGGSASVSSTKRDEASGFASSSAASALKASAFATVRGLTANAQFDAGFASWFGNHAEAPTVAIHAPSFQNASNVATTAVSQRADIYSAKMSVDTARKYRLRSRLWTNGTAGATVYIGIQCLDADGAIIGGNAGVLYFAAGVYPAGWTDILSTVMTGQGDFNGNGGWVGGFRTGTKQIRVFAYLNYPNASGAQIGMDYLYFEDVTESEQAGIYAEAADASAVAAGNEAASAASSSSLSAGYSTAARQQAINTIPSTFAQDGQYHFNGYEGAPTHNPLVANTAWWGSFPTVTGVGKVAEVIMGGTWDISTTGVIQVQAGRTYRSTVRFRTLANTRPVTHYLLTLNSSYGFTGIAGGNVSPTATTTWQTSEITLTGDALLAAGISYIRTLARAGAGGAVLQWAVCGIEDVTESVKAKTQADISAQQAASATEQAAAASNSYNLTVSYRNEAIRVAGNFGFDLGLENWYTGFDHGNGNLVNPATLDPRLFPVTGASTYFDKDVVLNPGNNKQLISGTMIPIDTSRKYKFRTQIAAWSSLGNPASGTAIFYAGFIALDSNGQYINHGGFGTYRYCLVNGGALASGQAVSPTAIVTGEGNDSWNKFPPGTKFIRLMAIMNYANNANMHTYLGGIWCEDATEAENAATQAGIATQQAGIATAKAAAAETNMLLSASFGKGYLNPNANFAVWPNPALAPQLDNLGWAIWSGGVFGGGQNRRLPMTSLGLPANNRPEGSEWVYAPVVTVAGNDVGLLSVPTEMAHGPGRYTVEATAQLMDGTLSGSGVLVYMFNSAGTVIQSEVIRFALDADSTGAVGSNFLQRRWSKNFTAIAGTVAIRLYAMGNWNGGLMGAGATKALAFYKVGFKSGSATDAAVETHSAVLATHETKLASHLTRVTAGAGTAELKLSALDSNGNAASQIALTADQIKMGSTGGGLTINGGKATFTGELNVGTDSGARVKITNNLIEVYDSAGVKRVRLGIW